MRLDKLIRDAITSILKNHVNVIKIAIREKAKFEGWLKFELASYLEVSGMKNVTVESKTGFRRTRSDISFFSDGNPYEIELKTPNTNWKLKGIKNVGRPITKNVSSIIEDTKKLNSQYGIIAFILFPVPTADTRWETYLFRIKKETSLEISKENNCKAVKVEYDEGLSCNLIICTYMSKRYRHTL